MPTIHLTVEGSYIDFFSNFNSKTARQLAG